jgi:hypothetical protein
MGAGRRSKIGWHRKITVGKFRKLSLCLSLVFVLSGASRAKSASMALQSQGSSSGARPVQPRPKKKKSLKFENMMMGESITTEGVHLGLMTFQASDGVKLTVIEGEFGSAQRAQQEFDKEIAKATKVIERGEKKDKTGKAIGERAQIMAGTSDPDNPIPAVVWTDGLWFHEIRSISMRDILELEKLCTH